MGALAFGTAPVPQALAIGLPIAVLLYTLLPHDATIMFAICLFTVALCTGTAIYLGRRMSPA